ncbi:translocation protein TolB [Neobacillus sp. KR4-4]|uniref:translocation protein TolB n=1 Tax=Neobacillus sp. KR4-4 TaxID=3344872 RepID=UPI0035CB5C3D
MKKICYCILFVCMMIAPVTTYASGKPTKPLKAAFIRNDDLWIKIGEKEKKITYGDYVRFPKWSFDGNWVAYLKGEKKGEITIYEGELWLYNIRLNKHFKVYSNINRNFQWAPNKNIIAFQTNDSLNMANVSLLNNVFKVASRIKNYSWLPDGTGFITSTKRSEKLHSDIVISKILLNQLADKSGTKPLYTIAVDKDEYFTSTSQFKYSPDERWIAFLLIPTASLSADSNTLCILSNDGKTFKKVDEMLNHKEWFQWALGNSLIGNISGGGREAIKNKRLKVTSPLSWSSKNYTPNGFVDRDLTWINKEYLITARAEESDWVEVEHRPLPALHKINLMSNKQLKLTSPAHGQGDFYPQIKDNKLVWVRTNRQTADIMKANLNGSNQRKWISQIDLGSWYYEKWDWEEVYSLYVDKTYHFLH